MVKNECLSHANYRHINHRPEISVNRSFSPALTQKKSANEEAAKKVAEEAAKSIINGRF